MEIFRRVKEFNYTYGDLTVRLMFHNTEDLYDFVRKFFGEIEE